MRPLVQQLIAGLLCVVLISLSGCSDSGSSDNKKSTELAISNEEAALIIAHYADVAHATFEDTLFTAKHLKRMSAKLVASPSEVALLQAREAWQAARVPYSQAEVFRFGNSLVDEWQGQVNAWPIDEGLLDYIKPAKYIFEHGSVGAVANVIANKSLLVGEDEIDLTRFTPEVLISLNEIGGSETNVATGYHAIEFLLWGQDLNGTGEGAGDRPYTDYSKGLACTHANCERRGEYLLAAIDLLISDLEEMKAHWQPDIAGNYREQLLSEDVGKGIKKILFGMGSLSLGELAGERMKVALDVNAPEEEQDCFSDNTHYSHYYNALGVVNVYTGHYQRVDGREVNGLGIADWVRKKNPELASEVLNRLEGSLTQLNLIVSSATEDNVAFDQLIAPGNAVGRGLIENTISALVSQTDIIKDVALLMGIKQLNPDNAGHGF